MTRKSEQLRNQIKLALECPMWNVAEYLLVFFLSWGKNYSTLSNLTTTGQQREIQLKGVCWVIGPKRPVIKNRPFHVQNTDNQCMENGMFDYCLYFVKTHGKMGVWTPPCPHQHWPAGLGLPCFPERHLIICLSWGGSRSVSISELLSLPFHTNASRTPLVHQYLHRP